MFETERLRLRAARKADFEKVYALFNDVSVHKMLSAGFVVPVQGSKFEEDLPTSISESLLHVIIETKDSGEFIGYTRLFKHSYKNRDAILGIALLPEFWGRGYATEVLTFIIDYAFQQLAMHRISLGTFANNTAAIKVYKRVGFVQEGVRRKANWMDGKWQDEILMAVLDEDWAASRQNGADA